jgi:hypothetical protein
MHGGQRLETAMQRDAHRALIHFQTPCFVADRLTLNADRADDRLLSSMQSVDETPAS